MEPQLHDALKPISWLLGKWKSSNGRGYFPTIDDFVYEEELHFTHVRQPNMQFTMYSSHPIKKNPMHREIGFIRVKPGTNQVAYNSVHNTGLAEVEEGVVNGQEIKLESHTVGRVTFGKPPATTQIQRIFRLSDSKLEQIVSMATENTPLTEHLKIVYTKSSD